MRRLSCSRGEIRLGSVITLLLLAFIVYEGFKFVPVLFAQYEFGDAVREEAKFASYRKVGTVRSNVLKKAQELHLPITAGQISVNRQPRHIRIDVKYQLSVEWLPGRVYKWDVTEVGESELF